MGVTTWLCPHCFTATVFRYQPSSAPLCSCRQAVMKLVHDSNVYDCGDFKLRLIPPEEMT